MDDHKILNDYSSPLPYEYILEDDLPEAFDWGNVDGRSYLTHSLNQHIPQYCGSCVSVPNFVPVEVSLKNFRLLFPHLNNTILKKWAHGAMSALADRIKIARNGMGDGTLYCCYLGLFTQSKFQIFSHNTISFKDINLSIQYILNCGASKAGSCHGGSHSGAYEFVKDTGFVPYDTCNPYLACSDESGEGICEHVDTTCSAKNICLLFPHLNNTIYI